jgi:hypothetical protein
MRLIALAVALTLASALSLAAQCTPRAGFDHCRTVQLPAPAATLTNFGLVFNTRGSNLSALESALAAEAQADGDDIVFDLAGGGGAIPHCLFHFNSATGRIFAELRLTISAATDIVVSYGDPMASSTSDCSSSTGAARDEEIRIANGSTTDFAGNSHTATANGSATTDAGSIFPVGWKFVRSTGDYLSLAAAGSGGELQSRVWTVSMLVCGGTDSGGSLERRFITRTTSGTRYPEWDWRNLTMNAPGVSAISFNPGSGFTSGACHWITQAYDSLTLNRTASWVDGVQVATAAPTVNVPTPNQDLRIGGHPSVGFDGRIETFVMRLDMAADSAAWQAYETAMLKDPNSIFSLEEAPPPAASRRRRGGWWISMAGPTASPGEWTAAPPEGSCDGVVVGEGCEPFDSGLSAILGADR